MLRGLVKVGPEWLQALLLPKTVDLVEHIDVVWDFLPAQEAMQVWHKDHQLLKAFSKGDQHCQAMGTPGWIFLPVLRGNLWRAGPGGTQGLLLCHPGCPCHVPRAAELEPEQ